jgi:hypothetical protein
MRQHEKNVGEGSGGLEAGDGVTFGAVEVGPSSGVDDDLRSDYLGDGVGGLIDAGEDPPLSRRVHLVADLTMRDESIREWVLLPRNVELHIGGLTPESSFESALRQRSIRPQFPDRFAPHHVAKGIVTFLGEDRVYHRQHCSPPEHRSSEGQLGSQRPRVALDGLAGVHGCPAFDGNPAADQQDGGASCQRGEGVHDFCRNAGSALSVLSSSSATTRSTRKSGFTLRHTWDQSPMGWLTRPHVPLRHLGHQSRFLRLRSPRPRTRSRACNFCAIGGPVRAWRSVSASSEQLGPCHVAP